MRLCSPTWTAWPSRWAMNWSSIGPTTRVRWKSTALRRSPMRCLSILLLALCPAPLLAQKTESDQQTLQALLSEVRELRLAIERSTLLGTRAQIALSRLQTQEEKAARLSQQLAEAHKQ